MAQPTGKRKGIGTSIFPARAQAECAGRVVQRLSRPAARPPTALAWRLRTSTAWRARLATTAGILTRHSLDARQVPDAQARSAGYQRNRAQARTRARPALARPHARARTQARTPAREAGGGYHRSGGVCIHIYTPHRVPPDFRDVALPSFQPVALICTHPPGSPSRATWRSTTRLTLRRVMGDSSATGGCE